MKSSIFNSVTEAVSASKGAYDRYTSLTINERKEIIFEIRNVLRPLVEQLAIMTVHETQMGNTFDKATKINLAIEKTPGVEDLVTEVNTGDHGMTLYEQASFGVVCAVLPSTNPVATLINNTISLLSAGNSVIYCPHPRAIIVTQYLTDIISKIIRDVCGIDNLVVTVNESLIGSNIEIMNHPNVDMVVCTGSNNSLRKALVSGKKVIGAGAANPVTIVDETANIKKACADIVRGASFDYNLLCTSEKCIIAVESIEKLFINELKKNDVIYIDDETTIEKLRKCVITQENTVNKKLEGRSCREILLNAEIGFTGNPRLIVCKTSKFHHFATLELLMPLVPLVVAKNFEEALDFALFVEQGCKHTATVHSESIEHLNLAANKMQTSVFVKNGSSLLGIGFDQEGYTSFTIANATGEGTTSARHFTKRRRCVLTNGFTLR